MNPFNYRGAPAVGAACSSFLILQSLLAQLEAAGVLSREAINQLLTDAASQVPGKETPAKEDALGLIESLKK